MVDFSLGGGRLRTGRERRSVRRALWTMVAPCTCVVMVGGLVCSRDLLPQPPRYTQWDASQSNPKCMSERCVAFSVRDVCKDGPKGGGACPSETVCSQATDDGTECFCRCCCQYKPADWQCKWASSSEGSGQPIRTPGSLAPGESCTAVCQRGYIPKDVQTQSEAFTCSADTGKLEPPPSPRSSASRTSQKYAARRHRVKTRGASGLTRVKIPAGRTASARHSVSRDWPRPMESPWLGTFAARCWASGTGSR